MFDYTNRGIIKTLLGLTDGALSPFYRSLSRAEKINILRNPISISQSSKLIVLTRAGFDRGLTINPDIDIDSVTHKKNIPTSLVRHQLFLQKYLVDNGVKYNHVVSDKILRKRVDNGLIVPDAVAVINGIRVGVEVELTRKKPNRVYYKMQRQVNLLRSDKKLCEKFVYVFESEAMRDNYKRLFDAEIWPTVKVKNSKYLVSDEIHSETAFRLTDEQREKFEFIIFKES